MRQLDLLITQARRATENTEFSDTVGISDNEFIQYANDAQDELESIISKVNADAFLTSKVVTLSQGLDTYNIPSDALLGTKVALVMYSPNGVESSYRPLNQGRVSEMVGTFQGTPSFFVRLGTTIRLIPAPYASNSTIKIYYAQKLPRLDIRSGKVATVALSGTTITSMTLDTASTIDRAKLLEEGFCTIVSDTGTVKMKNVPITDVNETTGTVTFGSFTYESGETAAVGDYLIRGARSSSHSMLPDICERYLLSYMQWRILKRDSSNDASEQSAEMEMMRQSIQDAFAEPDMTVDGVAVLDSQFLDIEGRL